MQDKIIAAIAAYLEGKMLPHYAAATTNMVGCPSCQDFCQEIAHEIAAAIAPLVEAGEAKDYPYTALFDHMANEHGLTLTNTELGDIIHVVISGKK